MSEQCTVAIFDSLAQAKSAVARLEETGYPGDQLSIAARGSEQELQNERSVDTGDQSERRWAQGSLVGGAVGLLLASPLLLIPGGGVALLAGPIGAGMAGSIVGGLLGAMSGWGVPSHRIEQYEQLLHEGRVMVIANGSPHVVVHTERLLQETDASEVHFHAATSVDDPSIDDRPQQE